MRSGEAVEILRGHERELRERGVAGLALVGSVARDEARPDSDIDVMIDLEPGRKFSLLDLSGVRLYLADLFGRETDVLIREDLRSELRARLEAEAVRVF